MAKVIDKAIAICCDEKFMLKFAYPLVKSILKNCQDVHIFIFCIETSDRLMREFSSMSKKIACTRVEYDDTRCSFHDFCVIYRTKALLNLSESEEFDIKKVVYIDADALVINPLDRLWEILEEHEITASKGDNMEINKDFRIDAPYGGGVFGLRITEKTREFCRKWDTQTWENPRFWHDQLTLMNVLWPNERYYDFFRLPSEFFNSDFKKAMKKDGKINILIPCVDGKYHELFKKFQWRYIYSKPKRIFLAILVFLPARIHKLFGKIAFKLMSWPKKQIFKRQDNPGFIWQTAVKLNNLSWYLISQGPKKDKIKDRICDLRSRTIFDPNEKKIIDLKKSFNPLNRRKGISGYMHILGEEPYLKKAILSHLPLVNEIIIVYHDCPKNTLDIIKEVVKEFSEKISAYEYKPKFKIMGEDGWDKISPNSEKSMVNFLNYTLSKTNFQTVFKIGCKNVAIPSIIKRFLKEKTKELDGRYIYFSFFTLKLLRKNGKIFFAAEDPFKSIEDIDFGFFKVYPRTYYTIKENRIELNLPHPKMQYAGFTTYSLKHLKNETKKDVLNFKEFKEKFQINFKFESPKDLGITHKKIIK